MGLPDEDLRVVDARPDVLAEFWEKEEQLDSFGLAAYAKEIGLTPPGGVLVGRDRHGVPRERPEGWRAGMARAGYQRPR